MNTLNDAQKEALWTGIYYCRECGGFMEFEDECEITLVCPECGFSIDWEHYGFETEDDYLAMYPTKEEAMEILGADWFDEFESEEDSESED